MSSLKNTLRGVPINSSTDFDARELAERAWSGMVEANAKIKEVDRRVTDISAASDKKLSDALLTTAVIQGQFRTIIALLSAIGALLVGACGWIVIRVDSQGDRAREASVVAAKEEVQKSDSRHESRMAIIASDAAREAVKLLREEQRHE